MKSTILLLLLFFVGSEISNAQETKNYSISAFESLEISGAYTVHLTQGNTCALKIEANKDVFEHLDVKKNGTKLIINFKESDYDYNGDIVLWISSPKLSKIEINGAVDLECENTWNLQDIAIEANGASKMDWNINCQTLDLSLNGASSVDITGNVQRAEIEISGAGNLDAKDFIAKNMNIALSGAGNAKVYANQTLGASISGIGIVKYYGNPKLVNSDVSFLGVLQNAEN
jgi:hypothetical protein